MSHEADGGMPEIRDQHSKKFITKRKNTMKEQELTSKIERIKELEAQQEEINAELEGLKDTMKAYMVAQNAEKMLIGGYKVNYKNTLITVSILRHLRLITKPFTLNTQKKLTQDTLRFHSRLKLTGFFT